MALSLKDIQQSIISIKAQLRANCIKKYTVSTLPIGCLGVRAFVTDAIAPSFLTPVVGGGTVATPVFFNGTVWVAA